MNKSEENYRDRDITYYRKHGDLIIWKQLLEHSKLNSISKIIFITGDKKSDWWWNDETGKTLGPLPELSQEIRLKSGVEAFWMYTADQFLQNAEKYLQAKEVTKEAVQKIKDVSENPNSQTEITNKIYESDFIERKYEPEQYERDQKLRIWQRSLKIFNDDSKDNEASIRDASDRRLKIRRIVDAVKQWCLEITEGIISESGGMQDFVIDSDSGRHGYNVKLLGKELMIHQVIGDVAYRGYIDVSEGRLSEFSLILVVANDSFGILESSRFTNRLTRQIIQVLEIFPIKSIIYGYVSSNTFYPMEVIDGAFVKKSSKSPFD